MQYSNLPCAFPISFKVDKPVLSHIMYLIWGKYNILVNQSVNYYYRLCMVACACDLSTQEAEAGVLLVWCQPVLHSKFQSSLGYVGRLCLKKNYCYKSH
jgi:hypothetical protein